MLGDPIPTHNLLKNTPQKEAGERPKGQYASLVLDGCILIAALFLSYAYRSYTDGISSLSILVVALSMFGSLSLIQMLLLEDWMRRVSVLFLESLLLMVFFYDLPLAFLVLVALVVLAFFTWGEWLGREELDNGLQLRFFRNIKPCSNKLVTGLTLAGVLLMLPSQWGADGSFISMKNFQSIYDLAVKPVSTAYPELVLQSSLKAFAESIARVKLEASPNFKSLSSGAEERALHDATEEVVRNLEVKTRTEVKQNENFSTFLYKALLEYASRIRDEFGSWFLVVWSAIIFSVARSIGFIAHPVMGAIAYVIYQTLLALNIIRISGESRMHETIEYY